MSLIIQARMSEDADLMRRIAAAAGTQGVQEYPTSWAHRMIWQLVATVGWVDAYEGCECGVPGVCEDAITDLMIMDAVAAHIPPPEPDPEPVE